MARNRNNPLDTIEQTFGGDPYGLAGQAVYDNQRGTWTDALTGKTGRASQPFGIGLADQLEKMAKANDALSRQSLQSATSAANSASREAQQAHTSALKALDSLTNSYESQINQELKRREREAALIRREQERQAREAQRAQAKENKAIAKAKSVRDLPQDMLSKIPKFDPTKISGWDKLTHPDRQRLYDEYSKAVTDGIKSINPNFDEFDVSSYVAELNKDTLPRMQKRTWGEAFSDWANLAAAAVDKVQQSAYYDLIDPSSAEAKANRAERQSHLNQLSYQTRSELRENEIRSQEAKAAGDTGFWAWLQNVRNSPAATLSQDGAEAAAGIGLAGVGVIGTYASGGTASGATVPLIGTGASMLFGAASSAGGLRGDIYQRIHEADDAYLQSNSADYRELRKTLSESAAKDALGSRVTDHLPELITAASVGAVMERFGLGKLGTAKAFGAAAQQGVKAAAGRIGREALSEGVEEAVQQGAANYGFRRYDPNQALSEDVLLAAGMGATLGGGAAGVLNTGTAIANRNRNVPNTEEAAQQGVIGDVGFAEDSASGTPPVEQAVPAQAETTVIENVDGTYTMLSRTADGQWQYDPRLDEEVNPRSAEADAFILRETTDVSSPDSDVAASQTETQTETQQDAPEALSEAQDVAAVTDSEGQTETATRPQSAIPANVQAIIEQSAELNIDDEIKAIETLRQQADTLTPAERTFIAESTDPQITALPIYEAVKIAGLESRMVAGNAWADSVFDGSAATPLAAVADNAVSAGSANAEVAAAVSQVFQQARIPMPRVSIAPTLSNGARGSYNLANHSIRLNKAKATASTVVHEYMHAATVPGLSALSEMAAQGDTDAKMFQETLKGVHQFLKSKAGGKGLYGNESEAEMLAEIMRPEFMKFADRYTLQDAADEGFLTDSHLAFLRENADLKPTDKILELIKTITQVAVRAANSALGRPASDINQSDEAVSKAVAGLATIAAKASGKPKQQTEFFEKDPASAKTPSSQTLIGVSSLTDPIADDEIPDAASQRDAVDFIESVEEGRSVASSYWRTNLQNAVQDGNVKSATRKLVRDLVSKADEIFADSIRPFRNWLNTINDAGVIEEQEVNRVMGSLYRASSYRDALLRRMREEWGLEQIEETLSEISKKAKISRSTAIEWAGMWMSAVYAPEATMHILNRNAKENKSRQTRADNMQAELDGMDRGSPKYQALDKELRSLQKEIAEVSEEMRLMLQAANDPTIRRKALYKVGGGMNFATAAKIRSVIESKIDPELLKSLHTPMRKMMAYRLAMDVESGKSSVAKMIEFTGKPELRDLGNALVSAAAAADSRVDGSMQRLDAARDALATAAESNYVPLTGNPEHAMSVELFGIDNFGQQSRAPNGGRNYRMEGRRELPDSAIKAAMSAAISSATYAGYKSFGDHIAVLHRKLTPEQRDQFGLHAAALDENQGYPENAIIVRRNGRITAYRMTDEKAFEALRKGNLDLQRNQLGEMIGGVTRKMAWLMTQGNPYFIARQIVQDGWERGTTLMGRELYDAQGRKIDSVAVARQMRNLLLNPFQLAKMANAALAVSFKRNKLMNRVFNADPYTAEMIKELLNEGGISTRASLFAYSSADLERSMQKNRKAALPIVKNAVVDFMDGLNNAVEYTTALAAYISMREHGMSKSDAISTQLDLANFRKKGTANAAFAPLWAFAQPAFMGGSNLISSAFDRQGRPKAKTMKYLASRTAILLVLQTVIRAIAEDDEGGDQVDQLNHYTLASRLPIPLGDGATFDMPLGFGLARVANAAARGMLGVGSGDKSVKEAATGILTDGIIAGVSPIQPSEINPQKRPAEWALATFVPTVFKPVLEVAVNRNSFDGRIINNANPKKDEFNWQQFGGNTSEFWREIAKGLHEATGIDLAPEQTRHLIRGYLPGLPANLMREFVDRPYAESIGRNPGNSLFEPFNRLNTEAAINGQFNKMNEEIEDLIKVRSVDPAAFTHDSEEYQLIAAYEGWKKRSYALTGRMKSITQSPMSEEAKERARTQVRLQRTEEGRKMLAEYRRIKGLDYELTK